MRRRLVAVLAAGLLIMGLAGCGENQIPEMTDEQMRLLGEYTAMTLMKYDASNRSRLVDYTWMITTSQPDAAQGQEDQGFQESLESQENQEQAGMDPVDDTPIVDGISGGGGGQSYSMEDVLELPEGVSIVYTDKSLYDTYPEDGSFTVTASEGKQLLVLEFVINNATDQNQFVDLLSLSPDFKITVNGKYTRKAMPTWMEEDLSVYRGTIPSMESVSTILIIELDDETAANLSSISLSLKNDSKTCAIQLL